MYWGLFFTLAAVVIRGRRSFPTILFWLWAGGFFFFFQWGLHLYNAYIGPVGHPRQLRYLLFVSAPVSILVGWGLFETFFSGRSGRMKAAGTIVLAFLWITSFSYAWQGSQFLRSGMKKVRLTAEYLAAAPEKPIYLPDSWSQSKFYFFVKYDYDTYRGRLHTYRFKTPQAPDAVDTADRGISDAYVVIEMSPYSYGSRERWYPDFCRNPPKQWALLKEIDVPSRGLFDRYAPKIYYAPPQAADPAGRQTAGP
jgi:hypothetical protein